MKRIDYDKLAKEEGLVLDRLKRASAGAKMHQLSDDLPMGSPKKFTKRFSNTTKRKR